MKKDNIANTFLQIDTEALQALADITDVEDQAFLQNLVVLFQQDTDESLRQLQQHIDNNDFSAIALITHRLKSSSANLAAKQLVVHFTDLEKAAKQQEKQNLRAFWLKIQESYKLVILDLERYISQ